MRIDKPVALGALNSEIARLNAQMTACDDQFARLAAITTPGLEGQAAQEFRANVRRYAVVILAHRFFYEAVRNADHQNRTLVAELPTTDGAVLDTDVAQMRIDAAEAEIARLRIQKEQAIARAQKTNDAITLASVVAGPAFAAVSRPIDISAIERYYDSLISIQFENIEYNRMILALAARYDSQSAAIYQSVDLNVLNQSTNMMATVLNRGVWGSMAWGVDFLSKRYSNGSLAGSATFGSANTPNNGALNAWQSFLDGNADSGDGAVRSASIGANAVTRGAAVGPANTLSSEAWRTAMQNRGLGSPMTFSATPPSISLGYSEIYSNSRGVISGFLHTSWMMGSSGIRHGGIGDAAVGRISGSGLSHAIKIKYSEPDSTFTATGVGSGATGSVSSAGMIGKGATDMSGRPIGVGAGKSASGPVMGGFRRFEESGAAQRILGGSGVVTGTTSRTISFAGVDVTMQTEERFGGYKVGGGQNIDLDASDQHIGRSFDVNLGHLGVGLGISIDWSSSDTVPSEDVVMPAGNSEGGHGGMSGVGGGRLNDERGSGSNPSARPGDDDTFVGPIERHKILP